MGLCWFWYFQYLEKLNLLFVFYFGFISFIVKTIVMSQVAKNFSLSSSSSSPLWQSISQKNCNFFPCLPLVFLLQLSKSKLVLLRNLSHLPLPILDQVPMSSSTITSITLASKFSFHSLCFAEQF